VQAAATKYGSVHIAKLCAARHGQKNVVEPSSDCSGSSATPSRSLNPYEAKASAIQSSDKAPGKDFAKWSVASGQNERNVWALQDDDSPTIAYVDLLVNPEGYTGYTGPTAWRIWESIYDENCFPVTGKDMDGMCAEQRVFYRLISGLQTSINTHIALTRLNGKASLPLWLERVGTHTERMENMYFAYLFLLRALAKARPVLLAMKLGTGNAAADSETRELLKQLLNAPSPQLLAAFDETQLFKVSKADVMATCPDVIQDLSDLAKLQQQFVAQSAQKQKLREQLRGAFRNVSRVLDCVGCDKCRLWGKIQFLGLGTGMKILFADSDNVISETAAAMESQAINEAHGVLKSSSELHFQLSQNEVVALVNTLHRLSISIHAVRQFKNAEVKQALTSSMPAIVVGSVVFVAAVWTLKRGFGEKGALDALQE
jgi:hypothetical protein